MKRLLLSSVILLTVSSCRTEFDEKKLTENFITSTSVEQKEEYFKNFAGILAKALKDNQGLRLVIKEESLKMFNNDYDVLYSKIKDIKIDGKSVEEILNVYTNDKLFLTKLNEEYPTLTILVPELPENSFSANLWNVASEVPQVAYTSKSQQTIMVIDFNNVEKSIPSNEIPGYPLVVVKENERVFATKNVGSNNINSKATFAFIDSSFDNITTPVSRPPAAQYSSRPPIYFIDNVDEKALAASNIYKDVAGWQRDWIYYNISPIQTNGAFVNDYQEHISYFWINDLNSLNRLIDQNDPTYSEAGWTDGALEFKITALINGKNGVGNSIEKYVSISPKDLFWFAYTKVGNNYVISESLPLKYKLNLPLINWDLQNYSLAIKITFEERDSTEEITRTESIRSSMVTNFGFDSNFELGPIKIGTKTGVTNTEETTSSYTIKTFVGSDPMGDVIINFADNIVTKAQTSGGGIRGETGGLRNTYTRRDYNSGNYTIWVEPKKVQ